METVAIILLIASAAALLLTGVSLLISVLAGAQFVRTRSAAFDEIVELAELTSTDRFVELGCGQGQLLAHVRKQTDCQVHGVEISPLLFFQTYLRSLHDSKFSVTLGRAESANLSQATAVYLYLLPGLVRKLSQKFSSELRPGARVICHAFPLPDRQPTAVLPATPSRGALYRYDF
jgi:trans-aconitate methyltransferase